MYKECYILNLFSGHRSTVAPRHRGLGEERTTLFLLRSFGKGARSNPATNSISRHHIKIETRGNLDWKQNRNARPRTTIDARNGRAQTGLDLKLVKSEKKRLDSKDVDWRKREERDRERKKDMKHSQRSSCSKKQDWLKPCFIECYPSSRS